MCSLFILILKKWVNAIVPRLLPRKKLLEIKVEEKRIVSMWRFFYDVSTHVSNAAGSENEMSEETQLVYKLWVYFLLHFSHWLYEYCKSFPSYWFTCGGLHAPYKSLFCSARRDLSLSLCKPLRFLDELFAVFCLCDAARYQLVVHTTIPHSTPNEFKIVVGAFFFLSFVVAFFLTCAPSNLKRGGRTGGLKE